jgi:hypothetical protein
MNVRIHTLFLWAPPEGWVRPTNHEIEEVTIYALLSTGMSPPTKRIALLNSKINSEKYKHIYQVEYLEPRLSSSTIRNPWTFLFKIIYFIDCYCHTRDCANALVDLYISYMWPEVGNCWQQAHVNKIDVHGRRYLCLPSWHAAVAILSLYNCKVLLVARSWLEESIGPDMHALPPGKLVKKESLLSKYSI